MEWLKNITKLNHGNISKSLGIVPMHPGYNMTMPSPNSRHPSLHIIPAPLFDLLALYYGQQQTNLPGNIWFP
jgi:hypothetical protein